MRHTYTLEEVRCHHLEAYNRVAHKNNSESSCCYRCKFCVCGEYVYNKSRNEFTYEGTTEAVRSALVDKRDPDIWHVWLSAVGGLDELSEFEDSYNEAIHITAPAEAFNAGSVGFSTYKEILKFEYAGQTWQYAEDNSVRGTLEVGLEGEQLTVDFTNYDNFSGHYSGTAVIVE